MDNGLGRHLTSRRGRITQDGAPLLRPVPNGPQEGDERPPDNRHEPVAPCVAP
jgi:hypothetical protein